MNSTHWTAEQRQNRATPFEPDEGMENLLKMRETDPVAYRALGYRMHLRAGMYEELRDKHSGTPKTATA